MKNIFKKRDRSPADRGQERYYLQWFLGMASEPNYFVAAYHENDKKPWKHLVKSKDDGKPYEFETWEEAAVKLNKIVTRFWIMPECQLF